MTSPHLRTVFRRSAVDSWTVKVAWHSDVPPEAWSPSDRRPVKGGKLAQTWSKNQIRRECTTCPTYPGIQWNWNFITFPEMSDVQTYFGVQSNLKSQLVVCSLRSVLFHTASPMVYRCQTLCFKALSLESFWLCPSTVFICLTLMAYVWYPQPQPVQAAFPLSCHAAPKQRATERSRCGFRGPPCHDVDRHEHYMSNNDKNNNNIMIITTTTIIKSSSNHQIIKTSNHQIVIKPSNHQIIKTSNHQHTKSSNHQVTNINIIIVVIIIIINNSIIIIIVIIITSCVGQTYVT